LIAQVNDKQSMYLPLEIKKKLGQECLWKSRPFGDRSKETAGFMVISWV